MLYTKFINVRDTQTTDINYLFLFIRPPLREWKSSLLLFSVQRVLSLPLALYRNPYTLPLSYISETSIDLLPPPPP